MSIFTDRLAELIELKGVTKKEFAEAINVSPSQITYYLGNREPSYEKLVEICRYFNVSTDYLTGKNDHKTSIDKTISDYINDMIRNSTITEELLQKYSIDKMAEEYFKNLTGAANINIPGFDKDILFESIEMFNTVIYNYVLAGQKWNEKNHDVLDELKKIMNHISMVRARFGNNVVGVIKNIYDDDSVDQETKNRIAINTAYGIKNKPSDEAEDKFTSESSNSNVAL